MFSALLTRVRDTIHVALQQHHQYYSMEFIPTRQQKLRLKHLAVFEMPYVWISFPLLQISQPGRQRTYYLWNCQSASLLQQVQWFIHSALQHSYQRLKHSIESQNHRGLNQEQLCFNGGTIALSQSMLLEWYLFRKKTKPVVSNLLIFLISRRKEGKCKCYLKKPAKTLTEQFKQVRCATCKHTLWNSHHLVTWKWQHCFWQMWILI